jgi:hypothetical protein
MINSYTRIVLPTPAVAGMGWSGLQLSVRRTLTVSRTPENPELVDHPLLELWRLQNPCACAICPLFKCLIMLFMKMDCRYPIDECFGWFVWTSR